MCRQLVVVCEHASPVVREKILWPETLKLLEDDAVEVVAASIDLFTDTMNLYDCSLKKPVLDTLNKVVF